MTSAARFRALLGLVILSGASALAVEIVLGRMLHRVLGSTSLSVASVLAGFLGGMGLGALAAERLLARFARPLLAYAGAELAGLGAILVLAAASDLVAAAARLPAGPAAVIVFVVLLSAPWGASFPFAVAAVLSGPGDPERVRRVYGWNAVGAAAGGLLAGLAGVPALGEWGVLAVCAAAQGLVGVGAALLSRRIGVREPPVAPAARPVRRDAAALAFVFLSGLVVLYWEVLWTRILVLVVGATVYSFSVMASSVVLGIGAGSLAFGGGARRSRGAWGLPALACILLLLGLFAVPFLPDVYLSSVRASGASPLLLGALGAGAVAFAPNFLLGCLFPWVVAARPALAGSLYAVNSAGAILGAFAGGPLAASLGSLEGAYRVGIAGVALLGIAGAGAFGRSSAGGELSSTSPRRGPGLGISLGLTALFAASFLAPRWELKRLLSGVYQWSREDLETLRLEESLGSREVLALLPGREVLVTVELERGSNTVYFRGNGKVEGSVPADASRGSVADLPTQVLLGQIAADLLRGKPDRSVLLIGLGSGVTLGTLLDPAAGFPAAGVDAVEIEPAFLAAIRHPAARAYVEPFLPAAVLEEGSAPGARPRFHFGDARRLLASELRSVRWDAVVSQPSEPWVPGAAPLFTVEFFEEAARHLEEGGVFLQWLQIYKLEAESVQLLVRTFRRVFPHVFILRPPGTGEVILVGSFVLPRLERLLEAPAGRLLSTTGLEVPADRLAVFLAGPKGVDAWVGLAPDLPVNTDGSSDLLYRGARSLHARSGLARDNLEVLRRAGAGDSVSAYLPEPLRGDVALRRLLARRNVHFGDFDEALELLRGDDSAEAGEIREEVERERAEEMK